MQSVFTMGCSRKYPYCKEHGQPLHKCTDCMNRYFPDTLISTNIRKRVVWKCMHNLYLDKCLECKQTTYQKVALLSPELFAEICEPQSTKRTMDFQSPIRSHWTPEPVAAMPLPVVQLQLPTQSFKRPRVSRGTVHRRTLPEPLTMGQLEAKRATFIAMFKRQNASTYTFGVYKLKQTRDAQHLYHLYVEVDYKHTVWDDNLLDLNLHGIDSYLLSTTESRKKAVLALRMAISQGAYKSKIVTTEQKKRIDEESKKQPFIKSLVDLISRWWLFVKYAMPFVQRWKRTIKALTASGFIAAERQAFFFRLQHLTALQLPDLAIQSLGPHDTFVPITPEMQRYPPPQTKTAEFEAEDGADDLSFFDLDVEDLGQSNDVEALVKTAHWATFLPTYSACGYTSAEQIRIPSGHITVMSQTTMFVESVHMASLQLDMFFHRLTNTYRITGIESKTITFEKIKSGNCMEPLHLGKLSAKYPNLNSGSILFKMNPKPSDTITLATFSELNMSTASNQVAKFLAITA